MRSPALVTGLVLFTLLSVLDVLSPLVFSDVGAPPAANVLSVVLGVVTLIGLALHLTPGTRDRAGRTGMWIAVVARVLSALSTVPAFLGPDHAPTWVLVTGAVFIVLTIVGVVLVRPALARHRSPAADPAPGALT
ncbi:hypothetical protein [Actinomycetospora sp. TBRC 11914]|uniref:hypothetical protein n=1 Tax=Actinomycetospora sp. TBRC 11914 TaxID=2729387 RepID=UPI00145CBDB6|nr:hypothetical protein [Actinomycetospora sp. TBRC 11914]NMO92287.1 hypothetical protein [Actinomycetospora sp. TBRC 11914]